MCCLKKTKEEIQSYLNEIKELVTVGKYQISNRDKNQQLYIDYVFSEEQCKKIILDLTVENFSDAVQNEHSKHPEEILYIFGEKVNLLPKQGGEEKTVDLYIKFNKLNANNSYLIVISFHEQEYPLMYKFT